MRAGWTAYGACTNGSTAPPRDATRRASGGVATMSTTSAEPSRGRRFRSGILGRLGTHLCRQCDADDRLVRVDAGYGRDADARKLDDVDDVDADARTDMAPSRCIVSRNVG